MGLILAAATLMTVKLSHKPTKHDFVLKSKGKERCLVSQFPGLIDSLITSLKLSQVFLKNPTQHVFENIS